MSDNGRKPVENKGGAMPLINIEYKGDGDYECDRANCRVRKNETIEWMCQGGEGFYAIHLGWDWPFEELTLSAPLGKRISLRIPKEARRGRYKYTVVVFDAENNEFFVDDPEFIIKP
jgi:hypothetical protein